MNCAIAVRFLTNGMVRWLLILALSGCSAGSMGGPASSDAVGPSGAAADGRTSLETQVACRQRANEISEVRDRDQIYAANSSLNSPFSANFQPMVPSRGLSGQFAYEKTIADCESNAATGGDRSTVAPPTAAVKGH